MFYVLCVLFLPKGRVSTTEEVNQGEEQRGAVVSLVGPVAVSAHQGRSEPPGAGACREVGFTAPEKKSDLLRRRRKSHGED